MPEDQSWMWGIAFLLVLWYLRTRSAVPGTTTTGTTIAYPLGVSGQLNPFFNSSAGGCA